MRKPMKIADWWPPVGLRASWLAPEFTEKEKILGGALDALVFHDRAAAKREGLPGCVELQHAERVLKMINRGWA